MMRLGLAVAILGAALIYADLRDTLKAKLRADPVLAANAGRIADVLESRQRTTP